MKAISVATVLFSAVLLWQSSISNGQTQGTCTTCSSVHPCQLGLRNTNTATSCQEIYQGNPLAASGNYWLSSGQFPSITVTEQYCDMDRTHGGIKGGWMRVAYFNMEDAGTNCPSPLQETNSAEKRLCIKTASIGCTSVVYSTHGVPYNRICGRVKGYQYRSTDTFGISSGPKNINSATQMVCPSPTGALAITCGLMLQDCRRRQTTTVMPALVGKSLVTNHLPL